MIKSNKKYRQSVSKALEVDVFTPLPEDPSVVLDPLPMSVTLSQTIEELSLPVNITTLSVTTPHVEDTIVEAPPAAAAEVPAAPTARKPRRPAFPSKRLEFPAAKQQNKKLRRMVDRSDITTEANVYDEDNDTPSAPNKLLEELQDGKLNLQKTKFYLKKQRFEMEGRVAKKNRPKRLKKVPNFL